MKKFFYIALMLTLFSCSQEENPDLPPKTGSYISSYLVKPTSLFTEQEKQTLNILIKGTTEIYPSLEFNRISNYYKDKGYNDYGLNANQLVLSDSIEFIHIYTLEDFNENFPKGTLIDDIIKIKYISYYDFINSGYSTNFNENTKNLSDFNKGYTKLFFQNFKLVFNDLSINPSKSYNLKIDIKTKSTHLSAEIHNINLNNSL